MTDSLKGSADGIVGVVPPMITPFTSAGLIYEQGVANLVDSLIRNEVHALFAVGSYGSFPLLETQEREHLAEIILKRVKGRVPVMGTGWRAVNGDGREARQTRRRLWGGSCGGSRPLLLRVLRLQGP